MDVHPLTTALGSPEKFDKLSRISVKNGDWRKVARMITKANTFTFSKMDSYYGIEDPYHDAIIPARLKARLYVWQALIDTKISQETKDELCRLYNLPKIV